MTSKLPPLIQHFLYESLVQSSAPLALRFSPDWKLESAMGDATRYGLDLSGGRGISELSDLFLGLDLTEAQSFEFVQLSGGRHVHLHLLPNGDGFWLLVVDASDESGRQQVIQQAGHEASLASHERGRALKKLKRIRSELEAQQAELTEANALKNALIATLSHEFRTPLTAIFGYLHLLDRRLANETGVQQPLRAIRRAATHLMALSENLLEFGRGEAGRSLVEAVPVDLAALADDLRDMFAPIAAEANLGFEITLGAVAPPPASDLMKLRQILTNLIGNALRYTPSGSVKVGIDWNGELIVLTVRDTGRGIPESERADLFKPFVRGSGSSSRGAGLGLSIVQRIVDQLGGSIELASKVGEGSTFTVRLPRLDPAHAVARATPSAQAAPVRAPAGATALVVDDDPDIAALLALFLRDLGFKVDSVGDGNSGLERAAKEQPTVLLVDVQMPGLSGNAAVYRLRSSGYKGRIVSVSATSTREARDAALAAGANAYVTKPIDLPALVRAVLPAGG